MPDLNKPLPNGKLVKLMIPTEAEDGILLSDWTRDSEYARLSREEPARFSYPETQKKWLEQARQIDYVFMIATLSENIKIGFIYIDRINYTAGHAWMGIGIGERAYWGKGYGTDAIELILDYSFFKLNLHRISLDVYEYNPRAIHTYEKLGFKFEGRKRQALSRDGHRWDVIYMGMLIEEWTSNKQKKHINE